MYCCLLPPLLSKWITTKTWKMLVMQLMSQQLNHIMLLYGKCTCIRIMYLHTYTKNLDIIWQYCIISQIKLHCFWKRSAFANMRKDALKYMINKIWYYIFSHHMPYQPSTHISPRAFGPWTNMSVLITVNLCLFQSANYNMT